MTVDAERLKELPLFARLSDRERKELAERCVSVVVDQGEHLLDEGYSAYEFYVIEQGTAAVISGGKHLRDVGSGDFLGEIGVARNTGRTASVIATSPVRAIAMSANDFLWMRESIPKVAKQIDDTIAERLQRDRLFGLDREDD